jgi:hypothetical protein
VTGLIQSCLLRVSFCRVVSIGALAAKDPKRLAELERFRREL